MKNMAKGFFLCLVPLLMVLASGHPDTGGSALAGMFGQKDTQAPVIRLKGWVDTQTVFLDKAYIEGQVSDENNIESLTINQTPVLGGKGGHKVFSHMANLAEGENTLVVEATDEAGNRARKEFTVTRQVSASVQLAERLTLAVLAFDHEGGVSDASLAFQDNLIDALVRRNRFRVIERDRLDQIQKEQKLSRTRLFDKTTALKVGQLVAAQSVIRGSIVKTPSHIKIVAQMMDTETSKVVSVQDVRGEGEDLPALRSLAEGMAVKFHRDFPLVDGLVIEHKGREISINLGQDVIKLQRRVIVFREEPVKNPKTGKVLGANSIILGRARITEVMPHISKAELLNVEPGTVSRMDRIITE